MVHCGGSRRASFLAVDKRLSSGGSAGAVATLSVGSGRTLALRWSGLLPAPVLSGDTATYRDVLPGVGLQVHADGASTPPSWSSPWLGTVQ